MGVYIKGMTMPKSCTRCRCCKGCPAVNTRIAQMAEEAWVPSDHRHPDCPLVPVPPHGDLIDRDALPWDKQSLMLADEDWALPCVLIDDAPTIIPEDKED